MYRKAILAEEPRTKARGDVGSVAELGSFYAVLGMDAKSLPSLRKAAILAPGDPRIFRVAEIMSSASAR
jgi:hypothetical protein